MCPPKVSEHTKYEAFNWMILIFNPIQDHNPSDTYTEKIEIW